MKLLTNMPRIKGRTFVIDEEQMGELVNNGINEDYSMFQNDRIYRYKIVSALAKKGYLFHGTNNSFNSFDTSRIKGGTRGNYGYGAYFTDAAYKCSEYGDEFVIINGKDMVFLDIERNIQEDYNEFNRHYSDNQELEDEIYELEWRLNGCTNVREYNEITTRIEELKKKITTPNNIDGVICDMAEALFKKHFQGRTVNYLTMNNALTNNGIDSKALSEFYLRQGYDGFKCGTEYVVFNFNKLNQNIVKDKDELINSIGN